MGDDAKNSRAENGADIDVTAIMAEIDRQIEQMPADQKKLSFNDAGAWGLNLDDVSVYDADVVSDIINYCKDHTRVRSMRDLNGPNVRGGVFIEAKKAIRRFTKFYIEPICDDQACFNEYMLKAIEQMQGFIAENEELRETVGRLERRTAELERRLAEMGADAK